MHNRTTKLLKGICVMEYVVDMMCQFIAPLKDLIFVLSLCKSIFLFILKRYNALKNETSVTLKKKKIDDVNILL